MKKKISEEDKTVEDDGFSESDEEYIYPTPRKSLTRNTCRDLPINWSPLEKKFIVARFSERLTTLQAENIENEEYTQKRNEELLKQTKKMQIWR